MDILLFMDLQIYKGGMKSIIKIRLKRMDNLSVYFRRDGQP